MSPLASTMVVILIAVWYFALCATISHLSARLSRAQLIRLFGFRPAEQEGEHEGSFLYPLRWYEEIAWPSWLLIVLVMQLMGRPRASVKKVSARPRSGK